MVFYYFLFFLFGILSENDVDIDGDTLEVIDATIPNHGTTSYDEDFVYYTPEDGYYGPDSFSYTITDNNGSSGVFATVDVTVIENIAPDKPDKPSGETRGTVGEEYIYTTSTTDVNDDQIYYYFSWGDGETSGWIGPYESGEIAQASHSWNNRGTYEIKVKAKDGHGVESEWSDPLPIAMPKSLSDIASDNPFFKFLFSLREMENMKDFIDLIISFLRSDIDINFFNVIEGRLDYLPLYS